MLNFKYIKVLFLTVIMVSFMVTVPVSSSYAQAEVEEQQQQEVDDSSSSSSSSSSGGDIFDILSTKAAKTLSDLRSLVYILAGFGLIVFAWAAIFGKISWKHLSQIGIGLFLVASMAPFIEYFTHDGEGTGTKLKFGSYIKTDFAAILGSDDLTEKECVKGSDGECQAQLSITDTPKLDVNGMSSADALNDKISFVAPSTTDEGSKKSFSVKDAVNALKSTYEAGKSAKESIEKTVKEGTNAVQKVGSAIEKAAQGDFGGALDDASRAVNSINKANSAIQYGTNDVLYNTSKAADSYQDTYSNKEDRMDRADERKQGIATNEINEKIEEMKNNREGKGKQASEQLADAQKKANDANKIWGDLDYVFKGVTGN